MYRELAHTSSWRSIGLMSSVHSHKCPLICALCNPNIGEVPSTQPTRPQALETSRVHGTPRPSGCRRFSGSHGSPLGSTARWAPSAFPRSPRSACAATGGVGLHRAMVSRSREKAPIKHRSSLGQKRESCRPSRAQARSFGTHCPAAVDERRVQLGVLDVPRTRSVSGTASRAIATWVPPTRANTRHDAAMAFVQLATIVVDDYDAAIAFFVRALGFDLVEDSPSLTNAGRPKRWGVVRPPGAPTGVCSPRLMVTTSQRPLASRSPAGSDSSCTSKTSRSPTSGCEKPKWSSSLRHETKPMVGSPSSSISLETDGTCSVHLEHQPNYSCRGVPEH